MGCFNGYPLPIRKLPQASYPYPSEGRENKNHNHRKLTKLIALITALTNSMKLWAMQCRATQDRWVMEESSDKTWSTGEGNGKPLQYSCLENPINSMKCKKIWQWKTNSPGQYIPHMLLEKSREIAPEWWDRTKAKTTPSCGCNWWWKQGLLL